MRRLHVFEESSLVATVSAFCEPWAFTIADFPGGEDMRHLHVFEESCRVATENPSLSVGHCDGRFKISYPAFVTSTLFVPPTY